MRNLCPYWLFYTFGNIYVILQQQNYWYLKISNFEYPVPKITKNTQTSSDPPSISYKCHMQMCAWQSDVHPRLSPL